MRTLSVGRSFRLVLVGLTLVLATLAGIGVVQLYDSRQDYEADLSSAYALEAAAGRLAAAGVVEEATLRTTTPAQRARAARDAAQVFDRSAADARALARDDPASARLVEQALRGQEALRRAGGGSGTLASRDALLALERRQAERRQQARDRVSSRTRRSLIVVGAFGLLALVLALLALRAVLTGLRRPIDELVAATRRLAGGDLDVRVRDDLPGELAAVGRAFNAMASDLERAQRALAQERERLAVTIESLADGLLVVEDGRIVERNPRVEELLGFIPVGTPLADVPGLPSPLEALAGEIVVERGRRTLAITASRLGFGSSGLVWTVRDVSERVRLERLKSEFVATASHELRSPLTSIKGFVELLNASSGLTERQREWVDILLISADRLVDLVNDLLDVARIEAGRLEIHRRPTDVAEAAREVARLLEPRLNQRGQRLVLALGDDVPRVMADPARVRQVLTNLLTNAHQYTQDGGEIELRLGTTDHRVSIAVRDNGRGMTAEQLEHVFERFYRGTGATESGHPGTGLGLAIVQSLVDLQGGSVRVSSQPGAGSTFTVLLPRAAAAEPPGAPPGELGGRRVLVVEGDPTTADAIVACLDGFGVETVVEHDARAAVARLRAERFDAMTLDVLLGDASGFEVLRTIRADPRLGALPLVLVSGFAGRAALSGEWVVDRPIDPDELADALGAALVSGRVRVLVVSRPAARERVAAALRPLGVEFEWCSSAAEVGACCARGWFEAALLDAGLDRPHEALAALHLRGRRLRRAVVVFSTGEDAPGLAKLDAQPLPLEDAGAAVLALLGSSVS